MEDVFPHHPVLRSNLGYKGGDILRFDLENVAKFLVENGFVYTIRRKRRSGIETAFHNGRKLAKVKIEEIGRVFKIGPDVLIRFNDGTKFNEYSRLHYLSVFVCYSGFKSEKEWIKAIVKLHGKFPGGLYLYRVEVVDKTGKEVVD